MVFVSIARAAYPDDVPLEAVVAAVPFEASPWPNRIFLNLAPDGAPPFKLMLDTGATDSYFTAFAARELGISISPVKHEYRHVTRLGTDLHFYVDTRVEAGSEREKERAYGLLGGNLLHDYVVDFDFSGRKVRFLDPKRYAVPESTTDPEAAVVPIRVGAHRPIAEIRVNGRPLRVLVDTGCPVPVVLSGRAARDVGIDPEKLPEFGEMATMLGPMKLRLLEAAEVEIGGLRFSSVPIEVAPHGWYGTSAESKDSVIGYDLVSRFRARIDYRRARMWLGRERKDVPYYGVDYAATRASGAMLDPTFGGRYRVVYIFPASPAARLGLQLGDLVTSQGEDGTVRTNAQLIKAIREGQRVRVARRVNGVFTDLDLPADSGLQR